MVSVDIANEITEAVDEFVDVLANPVTSASKFYTLYYLSEVKQMKEYEFDLFKEADKQADSFYNYSIFACITELTNLQTSWALGGHTLGEIAEGSGAGGPSYTDSDLRLPNDKYEALMDAIEREIDDTCPNSITDTVKDLMIRDLPSKGRANSIREIKVVCENADAKYDAFTDSIDFLRSAKYIFGNDWDSLIDDRDVRNVLYEITREDIGWYPEYGGSGWESVPETSLRKHEMGNNAFVDLMWSVEHNNGNFINKMPVTESDEAKLVAEYMRKELGSMPMQDRPANAVISVSRVQSELNMNLIAVILSRARNEHLVPLYEIANMDDETLFGRGVSKDTFPGEKKILEDDFLKSLII